jgi:type I restriction enzyme S subunit
LKKVYIAIPKKEEQRQIVEYLDKKCSEIDSAISDKEKLIEKLTEYKKSLIYECVTGKRNVVRLD